MHVFMLSCIKHACFHVFSAYFFPHDIIAEKGLLSLHFSYGRVEGLGTRDYACACMCTCVCAVMSDRCLYAPSLV